MPRVEDSPRRRRRGIYILPTLFTIGTIFCGFYAVINAMKGEFDLAALALGFAVVCDGMDGRIARLTNSTSEFGVQMDSLADVISFGLAPAILAFAWGVQFVGPTLGEAARSQLFNLGYFIAFLFLLCGAVRLARFNVQKNPIPKNPGRPDRKYFVGLPIPAAAAMVAAVVYGFDAVPLTWWPVSIACMRRSTSKTRACPAPSSRRPMRRCAKSSTRS